MPYLHICMYAYVCAHTNIFFSPQRKAQSTQHRLKHTEFTGTHTHTQTKFVKEYGDPYPSTPYKTSSLSKLPNNLGKNVHHCNSLIVRDGLHPLLNGLRDDPIKTLANLSTCAG